MSCISCQTLELKKTREALSMAANDLMCLRGISEEDADYFKKRFLYLGDKLSYRFIPFYECVVVAKEILRSPCGHLYADIENIKWNLARTGAIPSWYNRVEIFPKGYDKKKRAEKLKNDNDHYFTEMLFLTRQ